MACVYTYKGKDYSYAEFAAALHDGLLNELIADNVVSIDGIKYIAKVRPAEEGAEKPKPLSEGMFESNPDLANAVYEVMGFRKNIQFSEEETINDFKNDKNTTVINVIDVLNKETDPLTKELIKALTPYLNKSAKIYYQDGYIFKGDSELAFESGYAATIDGKGNILVFNKDYLNTDTILHELMHDFLLDAINVNKDEVLINELTRIFNKAKTDTDLVERYSYAFSNLDEFVSEVIGNKGFRQELSYVKDYNLNRTSNIFQSFSNAIKDFLKRTFNFEISNTLLDSIFNAIESTVKNKNQITPQQKQEALQRYSQYLEQNPAGDIEGFKRFVANAVQKEGGKEAVKEKKPKAETLKRRALAQDAFDAEDFVLQYFIRGGKISKGILESMYGVKNNPEATKKKVEPERKARISYISSKVRATKTDQLAEVIYDDVPDYLRYTIELSEVRDALEDVINTYRHPARMAERIISKYSEQQQERDGEYEADEQAITEQEANELERQSEIQDAVEATLDNLSDEQINAFNSIISRFTKDGIVDYDAIINAINDFDFGEDAIFVEQVNNLLDNNLKQLLYEYRQKTTQNAAVKDSGEKGSTERELEAKIRAAEERLKQPTDQEIKEYVDGIRDLKDKESRDKLAKRLRDKKIKGALSAVDFGLTTTIYNGALEFMASQVEKGTKLGNAIANTLKWIDERMGGSKWNKGAFAKYVNDTYTMRIGGVDVDVVRDDTKETADIINGFYSDIEQRVLNQKAGSKSATDWLGIVGKGDEAVFTGVRDWLESRGDEQVRRDEILQWMKDNRISVVEVVKGAKQKLSQEAMDNVYNNINEQLSRTNQPQEIKDFVEEKLNNWYNDPSDGNYKTLYNVLGEANMNLDDFIEDAESKMDDTRYYQYQLEGEKENYKEVLVTLPSSGSLNDLRNFFNAKDRKGKDFDNLTRDEFIDLQNEYRKSKQFKSTHFDEPNILVHLRMNTRTDATGKKVLFLEEIQSDWGQTGRESGFAGGNIFTAKQKSDGSWDVFQKGIFIKNVFANNEKEAIKTAGYNPEFAGIPTAPFVMDTNAWTKLGLKVALKEAVKQGADKIAWTTGEQQNERWGGLKDGGKGMKGFYGSIEEGSKGIVGSVVEALLGVKIGEAEIETANVTPSEEEIEALLNDEVGEGMTREEAIEYLKNDMILSRQPSVDVTPELRSEIEKGLPLFGAIEKKPIKTIQDATQKREITEGREREYTPTQEGREATEAGYRYSPERGGEIQEQEETENVRRFKEEASMTMSVVDVAMDMADKGVQDATSLEQLEESGIIKKECE